MLIFIFCCTCSTVLRKRRICSRQSSGSDPSLGSIHGDRYDANSGFFCIKIPMVREIVCQGSFKSSTTAWSSIFLAFLIACSTGCVANNAYAPAHCCFSINRSVNELDS